VTGLENRLQDPEGRPDLFVMGNDLTQFGEELVTHVLFTHQMKTLIFTGHDFSNTLRKVMLAYRDANNDDSLALQVARYVIKGGVVCLCWCCVLFVLPTKIFLIFIKTHCMLAAIDPQRGGSSTRGRPSLGRHRIPGRERQLFRTDGVGLCAGQQ